MTAPPPEPELISIIVPAKDEAEAIGQTIDSLPVDALRALGFDVEIVVLDGQSSDGTEKIAIAKGARVIRDKGEGKGAALRDARAHLRGKYIVMLDADGTYPGAAIPHMLDPILKEGADIVMGDRVAQPGSMSGLHRIGNLALSLEASVLYGRRCPDVCTGMWAFRADALRSMPLQSKGFEIEAEMFAMASRLHLRVAHVRVAYHARAGTTKLSAARDGPRIGWCLVRTRFLKVRPTRPTSRHATPVPEMQD